MDLHDELVHLATTVRDAKAMPMSASCLVNRAEMLEVLERLRDELPTSIEHAEALLSERDAVIEAGREQAERIIEGALDQREQLIEQTEVLVEARARAANVTMEARAESTRLLADADEYVDRRLADLEVTLSQLGSQVTNGRLRLTARRAADRAHAQETGQGSAHASDTHLEPDPGATPDNRVVSQWTSEPAAVAQHGAGSADVSASAR